jgi:hypothetical protein
MLIDGVPYNIVDTPGIFDTQQGTEIAKTINKCAYGVKAILIVFDMQSLWYFATILFQAINHNTLRCCAIESCLKEL